MDETLFEYRYNWGDADWNNEYMRKQEAYKLYAKKHLPLLDKEIAEVRNSLTVEVSVKKAYDVKMLHETDLEVIELRNQVDDYKTQLVKIQLALNLSQSALLAKKRDVIKKYKQRNPFDNKNLKKLQNKEYSLSQKIRSLR